MKRIVAIAAAVIALAALFSSVSFVGGDELGVLDPRFGDPVVLTRGIHFHLPFLSRVTHYPLAPVKVEAESKLETRDNLNFKAHYRLEQSFDPATILAFHARRGGRPLAEVRRQVTEDAVQKAATQLRADEILGAATHERSLVARAAIHHLEKVAQHLGRRHVGAPVSAGRSAAA